MYEIYDDESLRILFGERKSDKKTWVYNENYVPKNKRVLDYLGTEYRPVVYIRPPNPDDPEPYGTREFEFEPYPWNVLKQRLGRRADRDGKDQF